MCRNPSTAHLIKKLKAVKCFQLFIANNHRILRLDWVLRASARAHTPAAAARQHFLNVQLCFELPGNSFPFCSLCCGIMFYIKPVTIIHFCNHGYID